MSNNISITLLLIVYSLCILYYLCMEPVLASTWLVESGKKHIDKSKLFRGNPFLCFFTVETDLSSKIVAVDRIFNSRVEYVVNQAASSKRKICLFSHSLEQLIRLRCDEGFYISLFHNLVK